MHDPLPRKQIISVKTVKGKERLCQCAMTHNCTAFAAMAPTPVAYLDLPKTWQAHERETGRTSRHCCCKADGAQGKHIHRRETQDSFTSTRALRWRPLQCSLLYILMPYRVAMYSTESCYFSVNEPSASLSHLYSHVLSTLVLFFMHLCFDNCLSDQVIIY